MKKNIFLSILLFSLAANASDSSNPSDTKTSGPNYLHLATTVGLAVAIGIVQNSPKAEEFLQYIGYGKKEATVALGANALAAAFTVVNPQEYRYFVKWTPIATIAQKLMFSDLVAQGVNKTPFLNVLIPDSVIQRIDNGEITDEERAATLGKFYLGLIAYQAARALLPHKNSPLRNLFK